mmetsp:Transcript_17640/g.35136  ORF Transcript_17640/g.35136 Transcript_17640/m.35136 type:complete len:99 (+) Transcript_17640:396-692(+)
MDPTPKKAPEEQNMVRFVDPFENFAGMPVSSPSRGHISAVHDHWVETTPPLSSSDRTPPWQRATEAATEAQDTIPAHRVHHDRFEYPPGIVSLFQSIS